MTQRLAVGALHMLTSDSTLLNHGDIDLNYLKTEGKNQKSWDRCLKLTLKQNKSLANRAKPTLHGREHDDTERTSKKQYLDLESGRFATVNSACEMTVVT